MITKEEFEKAVEVCTSANVSCAYCPLSKKIYTCGGYLARFIKENEPALSANSTSSEVSTRDTTNLTHIDDSTKEQICQAYDIADKACTDILDIYGEMSEREQRAFDIGEVYGKICSTRDKLENMGGAN